jgi:SH3-like domain-containing protein
MKKNVSKIRLAVFLLAVVAMVLGASITVSATTQCVVTKRAPLRSSPTNKINTNIKMYLEAGTPVEVNYNSTSGKYVRTGYKGEWGWFLKGWVTPTSSGNNRVTVRDTDLYKRASYNSKTLLFIPKGRTVTVQGNKGTWYKVNYNNKTGYIPAAALDGGKTPMEIIGYRYTKNKKGLNTRMHDGPYLLGDRNKVTSIPPNTKIGVYRYVDQRQSDGKLVRFAYATYNGYKGYVAESELQ